MVRGVIVQSTSNPLQYSMTMTWTPGASAWGAFLFTVSFLNIQTNNPHRLFFVVILLIYIRKQNTGGVSLQVHQVIRTSVFQIFLSMDRIWRSQ